jgi:copper chaperone NosL
MNNKLSVASRILIAFASGALVTVFFLPAWRIDLFAPQYPEGLTMNIWINGLSGDVDVINGLNHYIGMKHITEAMFPEFTYLPYVVGFFMLLGMIVAITGKRKLLLLYLGLTTIGGVLAMYDFYKWGYDYGHNLDPKAPIQVPGLSYQPPLFGHKRLLNFDAYSFPDIGGWVVIGAAGLAFGVWLVEYYKSRKFKREKYKNLIATVFIFPLLLIISCDAKPEPFQYGKDICYTCKMGIVDPKFGCEVISNKGKVYKFDDIICTVRFLKSGELTEYDIKKTVVINFEKEKEFLDVKNSFYFISNTVRSPMGSNTAAFASKQAAVRFSNSKPGEIISWNDILQRVQ